VRVLIVRQNKTTISCYRTTEYLATELLQSKYTIYTYIIMSDLNFAVTEQVPVGTRRILESTHVSEGPGRIAKAPVPSIFVDDRGDIHRLRCGGQRINLLFSKKGVMRSGYLHPHAMHDVVVSGQVEVWCVSSTT